MRAFFLFILTLNLLNIFSIHLLLLFSILYFINRDNNRNKENNINIEKEMRETEIIREILK